MLYMYILYIYIYHKSWLLELYKLDPLAMTNKLWNIPIKGKIHDFKGHFPVRELFFVTGFLPSINAIYETYPLVINHGNGKWTFIVGDFPLPCLMKPEGKSHEIP